MVKRRRVGLALTLQFGWGVHAAVPADPTVALEHHQQVESDVLASELARSALVRVARRQSVAILDAALLATESRRPSTCRAVPRERVDAFRILAGMFAAIHMRRSSAPSGAHPAQGFCCATSRTARRLMTVASIEFRQADFACLPDLGFWLVRTFQVRGAGVAPNAWPT